MSDQDLRADVLLALIASAGNFPSVAPKTGEMAPMSVTEAIICADVMLRYILTGDVPSDADWARYNEPMQDAMAEAQTATKN